MFTVCIKNGYNYLRPSNQMENVWEHILEQNIYLYLFIVIFEFSREYKFIKICERLSSK